MIQYYPIVTGSLTVNGDLTVTGTGSMSASNSVSSSYAQTSSYANAFTVGGTLTAQTLVVQTITSSVDYITGSARFGSSSINTFDFTGSVRVSGSLSLENAYSLYFDGISDSNWRIYRNVTASFTKSLTTGSTLNINAHYGTGEGFAIGAQGGNSYYEILGSSTTTPTHFFRGSVGIGTTVPGMPLEVYVADGNGIRLKNSGSADKRWDLAVSGNNLVINETGVAARLYISSSGNIGLGNSAPQANIHIGASLNSVPASTSIAVAGDTSIRFMGGSDGNANYGSYIAGTQYGGVRALSLGYRQGAGDILTMTITQLSAGVGCVGIGITNPIDKLEVTGGIHTSGTAANSKGSEAYFDYYSGGARIGVKGPDASTNGTFTLGTYRSDGTNGLSVITIDSSGCVNIGGSAGYGKLDVCGQTNGVAANIARIGNVSGVNNGLLVSKDTSNIYTFDFGSAGSIRSSYVYNYTTATAANVYIYSDGTFARSTSSLKYKTDIKNYDKGLLEVMKMRPVYYKGKRDGNTQFAGLIAEEIHDLGLTEFVQYAEDGSPDALAYQNMVALLTKAIQELKAEFEAYKETHP